jgi:hypothetical protein
MMCKCGHTTTFHRDSVGKCKAWLDYMPCHCRAYEEAHADEAQPATK